MLKKNTGINHKRLKASQNKLEKKFSRRWNKINSGNHAILDYILSEDNLSEDNHQVGPSDRDQEVAATVIQWLGTEVGREFLDSVFGGTNFKNKYR